MLKDKEIAELFPDENKDFVKFVQLLFEGKFEILIEKFSEHDLSKYKNEVFSEENRERIENIRDKLKKEWKI